MTMIWLWCNIPHFKFELVCTWRWGRPFLLFLFGMSIKLLQSTTVWLRFEHVLNMPTYCPPHWITIVWPCFEKVFTYAKLGHHLKEQMLTIGLKWGNHDLTLMWIKKLSGYILSVFLDWLFQRHALAIYLHGKTKVLLQFDYDLWVSQNGSPHNETTGWSWFEFKKT